MTKQSDVDFYQTLLFLEELCCDLCRLEHMAEGALPESIQIDREYYLGVPGAFADIRVAPPNRPPYFVEVKFGYPGDEIVKRLRRKYGTCAPAGDAPDRLAVVLDRKRCPEIQSLKEEMSRALPADLKLEIWDEERLHEMVHQRLGIDLKLGTVDCLVDLRQAVDQAKGHYAFGTGNLAGYQNDALKSQLLWHFGFWRLRKLRETRELSQREILPPGLYPDVVILMADLCCFSSYVRDTQLDWVVRTALTTFYSKARFQIISNGGMLYQFVGDEVIGLFGIPDDDTLCRQNALNAARGLVHIGNAVSDHWQRHIDREQPGRGVHVGMAVGNLQVMSLRPFSRAFMGVIGDSINMAARLMKTAGASEIVISNTLHSGLDEKSQENFQELGPIEAHNVGKIRAWKMSMQDEAGLVRPQTRRPRNGESGVNGREPLAPPIDGVRP